MFKYQANALDILRTNRIIRVRMLKCLRLAYIKGDKKNVYEPCWYSGAPLLPGITFYSHQMRHNVYLVTLNPAYAPQYESDDFVWAHEDFIYESNRLSAGFSPLISI